MRNIEYLLEKLALGVEVAAVAVIILGIVITTGPYIFNLLRKRRSIEAFGSYRRGLARTLILFLEFLGGGHGKPSMVKASRPQPPIPGIMLELKKYFYFCQTRRPTHCRKQKSQHGFSG